MPTPFIAGFFAAFKQAILRVGIERLDAVFFGDETLEGANAHRRIDLAATAAILTWRGADATAHTRKGIRGTRSEIGRFIFLFGDELDVAARVGVNRTTDLARDQAFPKLNIRNLDFVFFRHNTPIFMETRINYTTLVPIIQSYLSGFSAQNSIFLGPKTVVFLKVAKIGVLFSQI